MRWPMRDISPRRLKDGLTARDISVGYGRVAVLKNVTLNIAPGEHVGLLGPNGAGKSTLLKCLAGLLAPSTGAVWSGPHEITSLDASLRRHLGIALVPEGRRMFASLTVEETLRLAHQAMGVKGVRLRDAVDGVYGQFPSLARRRSVASGLLSGGEQQMLCIARAMVGEPSILLVDEPFMGLAPMVTGALIEQFHGLVSAGVSMLIADESRRTLERLALSRIETIAELGCTSQLSKGEVEPPTITAIRSDECVELPARDEGRS
jgi:branched-chain amino acid transport system ATP-binding protein